MNSATAAVSMVEHFDTASLGGGETRGAAHVPRGSRWISGFSLRRRQVPSLAILLWRGTRLPAFCLRLDAAPRLSLREEGDFHTRNRNASASGGAHVLERAF